MDQAIDLPVVWLEQVPVGCLGDEEAPLRAEISASQKHRLHPVAENRDQCRQIFQADFTLFLKNLVHVIAPD